MQRKLLRILAVGLAAGLLAAVGCDDRSHSWITKYYDKPPFTGDEGGGSGIPRDPNISLQDLLDRLQYGNIVPSASFSVTPGNESIIRINVSGLFNPVTGEPIELEANENVFVVEDSTVKGLRVTKVDSTNILRADVVFVVDNSGSMGPEADVVAQGIIAFADSVQASGLDVVFGCVGYDGSVNGAINFTSAEDLADYLNQRNGQPRYGTSRTRGFSGPDSSALYNAALGFASGVWGENGVVGILFADRNFQWRNGSQRQFINFTDEPTQPGGIVEWSTQGLCAELPGRATVHTVFSEDSLGYVGWWQDLYDERPWLLSECTGGTVEFILSDASDLDLTRLPIVGVLSNSYLIEFTTSDPDGEHHVIIIIFDEGADGMAEFIDITYGP